MWVATHMFSAKNIRILCIESAKTVNEMTLNELVKLTTLWTTGPRFIYKNVYNSRNVRKRTFWHVLPMKYQTAHSQSDHSLRRPHEEILRSWPFVRLMKVLIRLCECADWSECSLVVHVRRYVFWRCGSYIYSWLLLSRLRLSRNRVFRSGNLVPVWTCESNNR